MSALVHIETGDRRLLAAISESMAEAARRSGDQLICRAGCTQCCIGPFPITQLDALRLREGLQALRAADPDRAAAVRSRAAAYIRMAAPVYPGDPVSGALHGEEALPDSLDDVACPALDPLTGHCDLYAARPITCRTFGPVTRLADDSFGACELCYTEMTEEQMLECAVEVDPDGVENSLLETLAGEGISGMTIVAYALASR